MKPTTIYENRGGEVWERHPDGRRELFAGDIIARLTKLEEQRNDYEAERDEFKRERDELLKRDVDKMVDRFLSWKLPQTLVSDTCVVIHDFPHPRYGTNLLSATEARQMIEHILSVGETPDQ
jgi:hypothetical protein